ncbi:hypothetical protein RclHR1_35170001 [Rhizophagus clarus]|uniref:BTB domain-containing protein n=1 Tax=Rhizophagus clarus TaxID=94130 RepID=A0A2Z6RBV1_9GLOM|nr:hypothetical protein RclHR1_35170001 [Rhizophagus clarus]
MSFESLQDTANDYEKLLNSNEEYDVIIYADSDNREIHAHSLVLSTRSQYFPQHSLRNRLRKKMKNLVLKY